MTMNNNAEAACLVEKKDTELTIELHLPGYQKDEVKVKVDDNGLKVTTAEVGGLRGELECVGFENFIPWEKGADKKNYFELEKISAKMTGDYLLISVPIAESFHPKEVKIG